MLRQKSITITLFSHHTHTHTDVMGSSEPKNRRRPAPRSIRIHFEYRIELAKMSEIRERRNDGEKKKFVQKEWSLPSSVTFELLFIHIFLSLTLHYLVRSHFAAVRRTRVENVCCACVSSTHTHIVCDVCCQQQFLHSKSKIFARK